MICPRRILPFLLVLFLPFHCPAAEFPLEQWQAWNRQTADRYPREAWLSYAKPEDAGWSSEKLQQARDYFDTLDSAAVMVIYDGAVLAAWGEYDRRFPCHSIRKSLLNAMYGIHVGQGNIDLNKTLADLNIDDNPPLTIAERKARVIDLLRSRSGVYHSAAYETKKMKETRPARGSHQPGELFWYNNWDFNTLCTIFEQESRTKVFEEFQRRFAIPLGMEDFRLRDGYYHLEPEHSRHAAYPFCMSARDLARIGLLFLREGRWNDRQILTKEWVRDSTAAHVEETDTKSNSQSDFGLLGAGGTPAVRVGDTTSKSPYAYGYLWWPIADGPLQGLGMFSARGYGGHAIDVVPSADLVLVHRVDTYWDVCSFFEKEKHRVKNGERFKLLEMILDARVAPPEREPALAPLAESRNAVDTVELEPDALDRYAKLYDFEEFKLRVTRAEDGLLIGHPGKVTFRLLPLASTEFVIEDVEVPVTFQLDDQGDPSGMIIEVSPEKQFSGFVEAFDFEQASRDVPKPREIWPIVRQHTIPLEFTVRSDEIVTSDTDPSKKLRKVTGHFWSQELAGKKWGHPCVIFLPEDNARNLTPERKGKVVIIGSPPREYYPVHVDKYGEPIAARTGYPTMVLSNPGEYPDGSAIESDMRSLHALNKQTGENYYNMNCQLAVVYIQAMNAMQQFLGLDDLKAVVGGHSKRGRSATVAAAMDPRVASVIVMGNEGIYATDRIQWHLSFHHAFFQDQVNVPVFYLGATNEDGYKMFNVNIMQERLKRPMTIEMIPNYCHSNFSDIQTMDFLMWVSHVFDGRPISQIRDVSHERQEGRSIFRAKVESDAKVQIVRAWYVYSDDDAWRDLMWYHLLMVKTGDHYEAVLGGKVPDAFFVEVGDIARGISGYVSSLPQKLTDATVIERHSRGSRPRLWEP